MNVRELSKAIGARVLVSFDVSGGSVGVYCVVEDVRKVWDRIDLMVRPESGKGSAWVSLTRIERTKAGKKPQARPKAGLAWQLSVEPCRRRTGKTQHNR